jgi:hypothetical protein
MIHLLTQCKALESERENILGHAYPTATNIKATAIGRLLKYAKETGIYKTFFIMKT